MEGWTDVEGAANYAAVSKRTLRTWLKEGMRHTRLPSGTIRIKFSWIDEFLEVYEVKGNQVDEIVSEMLGKNTIRMKHLHPLAPGMSDAVDMGKGINSIKGGVTNWQ